MKTDFSPDLVANSDAKIILQPTRSKTKVKRKIQTPNKASEKQRLDDEQFAEDSQAEEISTRARETLILRNENSGAYISRDRKRFKSADSSMSRVKVEFFLQCKTSEAIDRQHRKYFPRLKDIAKDINENWFFDLAFS